MRGIAYGIVAGVQLIEEPLVPSIDAILQNLADALQKAVLAMALIREAELQFGDEVGRLVGVYEDIPGAGSGAGAGGLLQSGVVGCLDEGDDETLDSVEELDDDGRSVAYIE